MFNVNFTYKLLGVKPKKCRSPSTREVHKKKAKENIKQTIEGKIKWKEIKDKPKSLTNTRKRKNKVKNSSTHITISGMIAIILLSATRCNESHKCQTNNFFYLAPGIRSFAPTNPVHRPSARNFPQVHLKLTKICKKIISNHTRMGLTKMPFPE